MFHFGPETLEVSAFRSISTLDVNSRPQHEAPGNKIQCIVVFVKLSTQAYPLVCVRTVLINVSFSLFLTQ